ncbi:alpha/beta fold hydrolase [Oceanobacillus manasiensis]|uniref:alpha/beta fold hydrolase n=1 Tax=Oceanobacillus manasiensis TaxID=586413 RepID=UPI001E4D0D74|nr:alpha/beta hydrolase [Oceanobacillus manasiensis]
MHGGPGYWSKAFQHYAGSFLEQNLKMIYLDQRGCGRSEHSLATDYSLNRLVRDIEELRTHLGYKEWLVMAHSFGGILAVSYAHQFPDKTKGLILSNVTLHMSDSFQKQITKGSFLLNKSVQEVSKDTLELVMENYYEMVTSLLDNGLYFTLQYNDLEKKKEVDQIDQTGLHSDPDFQKFVFSSEEYFQDFSLLTSKISKPVLIIAGEYDDAVGPTHHHLFQFKNQIVKVLESSHHPYIENQTEFNQAILHFLKVGL